jgi:AcrR family transcriptional regulator
MRGMDETDTRIAAVAAGLFHENGITATGVEALTKAAGVSKRTLYERFGSKDALIAAAYDTLDAPIFERFTEAAERATSEPLEQLEGLFREIEKAVRTPEFRGCPFGNAAAELADPDHPAHVVVRRHKRRFRRWMRERGEAAGIDDPDRLARQLMIVLDGVQAQCLIAGSAKPARDARDVARALIAAAPRRSGR